MAKPILVTRLTDRTDGDSNDSTGAVSGRRLHHAVMLHETHTHTPDTPHCTLLQ